MSSMVTWAVIFIPIRAGKPTLFVQLTAVPSEVALWVVGRPVGIACHRTPSQYSDVSCLCSVKIAESAATPLSASPTSPPIEVSELTIVVLGMVTVAVLGTCVSL